MDFSKINPRMDFMCPTCGQEVTSDDAHEHVTKTVVERYARYDQTYTCLVSGNAVGTDTHPRGADCDCQVCRLVEENIRLRVELEQPDPSPTWAELDNLNAECEQLRRDLNELALYTDAHHACLAGDDDCDEAHCREIRALLKGRGEPLEDVRVRIAKRRELAAQLAHAWCGDASSPGDNR
jgi:hypothetical protein